MQAISQNFHYPELVEGPLKMVLTITFPLELVTEHNVLVERMSLVAVHEFDVVRSFVLNR